MNKILLSKVIIMANRSAGFGGEERWGSYEETSKHLLKINNIPLIHLIQKQLFRYGFSDINILCQESDKEDYLLAGSKWISPHLVKTDSKNPDHEINVCRSLFSTQKSNIILFGDNFYTSSFFNKVVASSENSWQYYARPYPSEYVNKPYEEGFGWYIPKNKIKILVEATTLASNEMIKNYGRVMPGVSVRESYDIAEKNSNDLDSHMVIIDDETTDFDYPHEWDFWRLKFMHKVSETGEI